MPLFFNHYTVCGFTTLRSLSYGQWRRSQCAPALALQQIPPSRSEVREAVPPLPLRPCLRLAELGRGDLAGSAREVDRIAAVLGPLRCK